jgi:hypothetical protein
VPAHRLPRCHARLSTCPSTSPPPGPPASPPDPVSILSPPPGWGHSCAGCRAGRWLCVACWARRAAAAAAAQWDRRRRAPGAGSRARSPFRSPSAAHWDRRRAFRVLPRRRRAALAVGGPGQCVHVRRHMHRPGPVHRPGPCESPCRCRPSVAASGCRAWRESHRVSVRPSVAASGCACTDQDQVARDQVGV